MKFNLLIFVVLLIAHAQSAFAENDCADLRPTSEYIIKSDQANSPTLLVVLADNESQNNQLFIYLKHDDECRNVLSTQGAGIEFRQNQNSDFPDVVVSWHLGADDKSVAGYYVWHEGLYENAELVKSKKINLEALALFGKGETLKAIAKWKQATDLAIIPGLGYSSNDEALNNLGFAYYKLAKKESNEDYYDLAIEYLDQSIQVNYNRWVAWLNLGDIYFELNDMENATQCYERLLEINPDYKYAEKIKARLSGIKE